MVEQYGLFGGANEDLTAAHRFVQRRHDPVVEVEQQLAAARLDDEAVQGMLVRHLAAGDRLACCSCASTLSR